MQISTSREIKLNLDEMVSAMVGGLIKDGKISFNGDLTIKTEFVGHTDALGNSIVDGCILRIKDVTKN